MERLNGPRTKLDLVGDSIQLRPGLSQVGRCLENLANSLVILHSSSEADSLIDIRFTQMHPPASWRKEVLYEISSPGGIHSCLAQLLSSRRWGVD